MMITPEAGHYGFKLASPSFFRICFHSFQAVCPCLASASLAQGEMIILLYHLVVYLKSIVVVYLLIQRGKELQEDG